MAKKKAKIEEDAILDMRSYSKKSEKNDKDTSDNPTIALVPVWDEKNIGETDGTENVTDSAEISNSIDTNNISLEEKSIDENSDKENVITIRESALGGSFNAAKERGKRYLKTAWKKTKKYANIVFIDGMSGMALGLFATLIIGTIIEQVGVYVGENFVGIILKQIGKAAKLLMGAGIGVGTACKYKKSPLLVISAGVAGLIGAHSVAILDIARAGNAAAAIVVGGPGEPVGAFVACLVAIAFGNLVSGKTKLDIILTPLVAIVAGAVIGLLVGPPISSGMTAIGNTIEWAMEQNKVIMGILVAVLMGIALTAPISSAALGVGLGLSGLAAGAAAVGCCSQMVGFAVASFRENKWGGLAAQGIGTSMLQMPNIMRKPIIWLPAIITSAILGPISSAVLGMTNIPIGSGMGTAGLVGPLMAFESMVESTGVWQTLLQIGLMHFILPAAICLGISELMRKIGWIKLGDMKLNIN